MNINLVPGFSQTYPLLFQPTPSDYYVSSTIAWFFTVWMGGFSLLVLPWVFYKLVKKKDSVPILMWLGGFIASTNEAMIDHLGHLWWARNLPGPFYSGYDLHIPLLVPFCYAFGVSMVGYFVYYKMRNGLTMKGVFYVWLVLSAFDVLLEYPGTLSGAHTYYGDQPFEIGGFPWWWAWVNGTGFLMVGFFLWLAAPHLHGWSRLLILILPIKGFSAAYGIVAWPSFMALNWEMPVIAAWLLSAFSLVPALLVVRSIAAFVAKDSPLRLKKWLSVSS